MPIRPENRARYPADWPAIVAEVRKRSGDCCEGSPAFPDCRVPNGQPHPETGSKVVLTTAHLDHTPETRDPAMLRHWCQRCHLSYDAKHHAQTAYMTRKERANTMDLFTTEPEPIAQVLWDLAREYYVSTEAFDRTVCTGGQGRDGVMPAGPHELALINRNAAAKRRDIADRAKFAGHSGPELHQAMVAYSRSAQHQRDMDALDTNTTAHGAQCETRSI